MKMAFITAISALLLNFVGTVAEARAEDGQPVYSGQVKSSGHKCLILALGGGGTRGAAHIGVLRALQKNNIKPDAVVGTSIGAIVGGLYCAGLSPNQIEAVMTDKSFMKSYLTVPITFRLLVAPLMYIPHAFGYHPYDGLYHGNKFAKYIDSLVAGLPGNAQNPGLEIDKFSCKFAAASCDLLTAKPVAITKGDLGRALQASSAIPFLRRPVLMARDTFKYLPGKTKNDYKDVYLFVDGGPLANLPVGQAKELGKTLNQAFKVVAVDTYGEFEENTPADFRKIGSAAERSMAIMLGAVERNEAAQADLVIVPKLSDIKLLSKDMAEARKALTQGEKATEEAMPRIKQLLQ
jgi:NTE family protein